jgi:hypothetical protein
MRSSGSDGSIAGIAEDLAAQARVEVVGVIFLKDLGPILLDMIEIREDPNPDEDGDEQAGGDIEDAFDPGAVLIEPQRFRTDLAKRAGRRGIPQRKLQDIQRRLVDPGQQVRAVRFGSEKAKADLDAIVQGQASLATRAVGNMIPEAFRQPAAK